MPVALLVLGMHRSGTSALTRVLNLLGASLGDDLMPPGDDNPLGFWEHQGIVSVHEALLVALDRRWDDPRPMPDGWLDSVPARKAGDAIAAILRRDFAGVQLWAVKDPRLCRLMPLWRRVLAGLGIEPRVLLVSRHPGEVAGSLLRRDGLPIAIGELLWARYLLDAVRGSDGCRRGMVAYDDLLADWRGAVHRINQALATHLVADAPQASDIESFLTPQLRHHRAAEPVGEVVHLVHHHVAEVRQGRRTRVDHVAEHFGGHHHDRSVTVDRVVAGEQPHVLVAELVAEIAQLLVGERLERRGVENLLAMSQGAVDRVFAHQRLAGAGGGAHHHGMALVEGVDGLELEAVEREGEQLIERRHRRGRIRSRQGRRRGIGGRG